jgi:hypothetical protein
LFEDTPGGDTLTRDHSSHEESVARHETLRRLLLDSATTPNDVRTYVNEQVYGGDAQAEWEFINDWVALKDWANLNRHEVEHRYFASVSEVCEWGAPLFESAVVGSQFYDINPLRFNERGVNAVLHHLERLAHDGSLGENASLDAFAELVESDRLVLLDLLWGSENFRVLVDATRIMFDRSGGLVTRMGMTERPVRFAAGDMLKPLEMAETAPEFKLRASVVTFTRRAAVESFTLPHMVHGSGSIATS